MWHRVDNVKHESSGNISAECRIPMDSQWFLGHFPGKPILPGIAQLAMVRETINRGTGQMVTAGRGGHTKNNPVNVSQVRPDQVNSNRVNSDRVHSGRAHSTRVTFSRIKFKKMVTPGEHLNIMVSPKKKQGAYTFRITVEGTIACSGNIVLKIDSQECSY